MAEVYYSNLTVFTNTRTQIYAQTIFRQKCIQVLNLCVDAKYKILSLEFVAF